jgi:hypothetical protein
MTLDESRTRDGDVLARKRLLGILSGSWVAQGVYALVKLGVPDLLRDGPRTVEYLSRASQADCRALGRLLRALALLGLFTQPEPDTFGLTATTELLRTDVPGSVHLNALMQGEEIFRSFAEIMHTMHTGQPAFEKVYGQPFYDYLGDNPDAAHTFNTSMGNERVPEAIATCDLKKANVVVDVGGGNGALLIELLRDNPQLRGVLLELSEAIGHAREQLVLAGLDDRVECVEGSFFSHVPSGGDVYVLSRVLHNWRDQNARAILRQVHAAMRPGSRLLVLEDFLPETTNGGRRSAAGLVDLLMLVTLEGSDRTEAEYRELLVEAGFDVAPTGPGTDGLLDATRR